MSSTLVDFEQLPWQNPSPGVRYKVLVRSGRQIRLVEFGKEFVESDWCNKQHIGYILQGQLEIVYPNGSGTYVAGNGVFILGNEREKHRAKALSQTTLILVEDA